MDWRGAGQGFGVFFAAVSAGAGAGFREIPEGAIAGAEVMGCAGGDV
jgi:hypothetical protein